jgi:hypothetical protein
MRRRYDDDTVPPPELLVFDGRGFATAGEWETAFDEWHQARNRWLSERGLPADALPLGVIDGDCPFDASAI